MLNRIVDVSINGIVKFIEDFIRLFFDHTHNGINSKQLDVEGNLMHLSGDETAAGQKTFTTIPNIPTGDPNEDADAISKKYLDDNYTKDDDIGLAGKSWFVDEDDMSSDSAVKVPSQQSVKAYVDGASTFDSGKVVELSASDNLKASSDAVVYHPEAGGTYVKHKEIKIRRWGSIRVKFDLFGTDATVTNYAYGRVYINGVAVGTERTKANDDAWLTYSEDFDINISDMDNSNNGALIQLYLWADQSGAETRARNFRIYYDRNYTNDYDVIT